MGIIFNGLHLPGATTEPGGLVMLLCVCLCCHVDLSVILQRDNTKLV